jgi:hypothetical protein
MPEAVTWGLLSPSLSASTSSSPSRDMKIFVCDKLVASSRASVPVAQLFECYVWCTAPAHVTREDTYGLRQTNVLDLEGFAYIVVRVLAWSQSAGLMSAVHKFCHTHTNKCLPRKSRLHNCPCKFQNCAASTCYWMCMPDAQKSDRTFHHAGQ